MDVKVAKHGNKAVSSNCGSADVLEALKININLNPKEVEESIKKFNFAFMFAPNYHSAMKHVGPARKKMGKKTNSTTLSKFIWTNKLNQDEHGNIVEPKIKWSIVKHCSTYQPGNRTCDLCISEKVLIIKNINKPSNINKRTDCAQTCCHKRHYLSSVT